MNNTLKEYLNDCTKKELITIAKFHGMSGYSTLKKGELAEKLADFLESEEVIRPFFSCLDTEEIEFYRSKRKTENPFLARRLVNGGFCFLTEDGSYQTPSDFPVELLSDSKFLATQKKKSTLTNILNMSGMLYGCIQIPVICALYKKYTKESIKEQDMELEIAQIPEAFNDLVRVESLYVKHDFVENDLYDMIQKCQDTIPYYMPEYSEMIHFVRYGYFKDEYTQAFSDYLSKSTAFSRYEIRNIVIHVQAIFRQGGTMADVGKYLREEGVSVSSTPEKELMSLLNTMFAHSRLLLNRGYTESEKTAMNKSAVTKIYPNSPCPCGSGKKYKKCCGRR